MAKYIYPAVFTNEDDGGYSIYFPDIEGCYTNGDDLQDAHDMANDVLCLMLYQLEESGESIPKPTEIKNIETDNDSFVTLISADTIEYRKFYDNKAVKKTLTIPSWMNTMAEKAGINFSASLQRALSEDLHLNN